MLPADASGRVDLRALLRLLGERGVLSLLVEGGGVLHGSLFDGEARRQGARDHRAEDRRRAARTRPWRATGVARMADAITLRDVEVRLGDVAVVGYVDVRSGVLMQ